MRRLWLVLMVLGMALAFSQSGVSGPSKSKRSTTAASALKVGMALAGPKNDKGFNQSHVAGLLLAEKAFGVKGSIVENATNPQQRIDALKNLAADNQLVIGVGGEFAQAGVTVAPQFPKVTFMITNGQTASAKNRHVYGLRQGVPAFVAGVVAAKIAGPKGKPVYLGGELIPVTSQAGAGFKAGVTSAAPKLHQVSIIVGSFTDVAKAKEAASAAIASGGNVIYGFLTDGFQGMVQAVTESGKNVKFIGVVVPRCTEFPQEVGTTTVNSSKLVESMIKDFINKSVPVKPKYYGVENTSIQTFQLCPKYATSVLKKLVRNTISKINSGTIKLPKSVG